MNAPPTLAKTVQYALTSPMNTTVHVILASLAHIVREMSKSAHRVHVKMGLPVSILSTVTIVLVRRVITESIVRTTSMSVRPTHVKMEPPVRI